jgi:hypothetical protein
MTFPISTPREASQIISVWYNSYVGSGDFLAAAVSISRRRVVS